MSALAADRPSDSLKTPLSFSIAMHAMLAALLIYSGIHSQSGDLWGGPGGAISVGLVGNVPGIPMPRPEMQTPNRVVDETKGLYKTEEAPEIKQPPPPDTIAIPKFKLEKPTPKYNTRKSKLLENPTPPPENAVPYGAGGAPTVPYTSFAMGAGTSSQGGMAMGDAGGGNFGSRFSWYVEAVQRRISGNWLQSTIDPRIASAPRVIATFDILRDGTIANIQITRSSGNQSVDTSEVRAIRESSPLDRLPPEYKGSKVSVEFYFDFHR
ncbi:MAG: TonB family protein [Candidatus Acidiferrales bacterium]